MGGPIDGRRKREGPVWRSARRRHGLTASRPPASLGTAGGVLRLRS